MEYKSFDQYLRKLREDKGLSLVDARRQNEC